MNNRKLYKLSSSYPKRYKKLMQILPFMKCRQSLKISATQLFKEFIELNPSSQKKRQKNQIFMQKTYGNFQNS